MKKFHPLAEVFPLIEGAEFDALVADIKANGLHDPITLLDGTILDGRNRYRACLNAEVAPRFEEFEGPDPVAFVVSKNVARRHLDESQRAMAGAKIANIQRGGDRSKLPIGSMTRYEASEMLNVGERSVNRAREVLDNGSPELIRAVERGQIAVSKAADLTKATPEFQRAVVQKITDGSAKTATDAVRQAKHEAKVEAPELPSETYRVIYADPPWSYGNSGLDDYGHAERHYPTMTIDELCQMPVKAMVDDDAVLFMWVTSPLLEECFDVIRAWGFKYKTSFIWDKVKHNFGHYNSVRHELLLVCTRGSCTPDVKTLHDSVQTIERTEKHSEKPEEFRAIIDAIYPRGRRIELFSRKTVNGWDAYGNETSEVAA
jgi:N6-adenosine-specific RNA methylase IME4